MRFHRRNSLRRRTNRCWNHRLNRTRSRIRSRQVPGCRVARNCEYQATKRKELRFKTRKEKKGQIKNLVNAALVRVCACF